MATTSPGKAQSGPSKAKRAYRLEFDSWVLQSMIGLLTMAGLGIFYLGYLTGQGSRRPVAPVLVSQQQVPFPPGVDNNALKPSSLSINQALSRRSVERYDSNANQVQATTQLLESTKKLIANNKQQSALGRVARQNSKVSAARTTTSAKAQSPSRKASLPKAISPRSAPKKGTPKRAKVTKLAQFSSAGKLYTVQVFSSPQRDRAKNLANRLTNMQFEAVRLNQFQTSQGKVWHRVRVGRLKTRAQAQVLSNTIRKRTGLKELRVLKF